ncbi:FlgO family outer membrane protein [Arcobacteraceae bacterium]|nr:FlgO family outer membrane protein [Arcobacteraceae bacterium]
MRKIKLLSLIAVMILFTACSIPTLRYNHELQNTDYDKIISNLLQKASYQIFPNMRMDEILIVPNFAETTTLKSNTRLSFILSDTLKNKLVSKYSYTVREIELSKNFRFGDEGFKVLTRNSKNINNTVINSRYAVVGTYTITKNQLLLFLKFINIRDGLILASSTYSANLTQEIVDSNEVVVNKPLIYQPMTL